MLTQEGNLLTVSKRIGEAVIEFIKGKLNSPVNQVFTAQELRLAVMSKVPSIAPGSPDRILRNLRQRKLVNYVLISRVKSLYKAIPVVPVVESTGGLQ